MAKRFTVAVVDDHPLVRRGVAETFDEEKDFEVVAEGGSAADALKIAREKNPDIYLLDISMPGNGIDAVRNLRAVRADAAVVMLTIREELSAVQSALSAGAHGYVLKGVGGRELVSIVRTVLAGGRYVSPELAARLLGGAHTVSGAQASPSAVLPPLSERERQIFERLGKGLSNKEIADALGLTENTIKHYITPLLSKLSVRNRTEAALLAKKQLAD